MFANAAQHQPATAHIATPRKFGRESQPVTENGGQRIKILACCNAAQQDHFTVLTKLPHQGYLIRTQPNTTLQGRKFGEYAVELGAKKVFFMAPQTPFTGAMVGRKVQVSGTYDPAGQLAVTGRERLSLAPFLVASKLSERKEDQRVKDLDLDLEFRRYLGKQIARRTKMTVVTMPADVKLPSTELKALGDAADFWKDLGTRVGAEILLSGIVDFRVEDKSGYKTEEYRSAIDGRTYYRQVFVESTGFTFEVTVLAFDGRTGAKLFQETFKDQKEKSRRAADEMVGLFENLFSLENQLLGLFVVREREANRYVFN